MKPFLPLLASALLAVPAAQAATFCFDDTNTNVITNTANATGTTTVVTTNGVTTITNTNGANSNSGFASADDIQTMLGRTLNANDSINFTLTVDSIVGNLNANGFEFGFSPNNTGFRPANNMIFNIRANNGAYRLFANSILGVNPSGDTVTEASLLDGFEINIHADANGYTATASDIVTGGGATSSSVSGMFASTTQFLNFFDNAHYYVTAQKTGNPDLVTNISAAKLVIPEPSRAVLLLSGAFLLVLRRRR